MSYIESDGQGQELRRKPAEGEAWVVDEAALLVTVGGVLDKLAALADTQVHNITALLTQMAEV